MALSESSKRFSRAAVIFKSPVANADAYPGSSSASRVCAASVMSTTVESSSASMKYVDGVESRMLLKSVSHQSSGANCSTCSRPCSSIV